MTHARHRRHRLHRPAMSSIACTRAASASSATTAGRPRPACRPDVARVQRRAVRPAPAAATIADHDVRRIVHAAGMSDPLLSIGMPTATVAANAIGTVHLLEAARLADFGGRIVLLSSTSVYGHNDEARRRAVAAAPAHARTRRRRRSATCSGRSTHCRFGLDVVSLCGSARPTARAARSRAWCRTSSTRRSSAARCGSPAGADQPCHPIHVDDVARAVDAALDAPEPLTAASTTSRAASGSRSARWSRSCAIGSPTPTSSSVPET